MPAVPQPTTGDDIAIVGIGGIFADSESPDRLWSNVVAGRDVTRDVPTGRWIVDPVEVLDPEVGRPDRTYTTRGGFVGPSRFDPSGTRLDPAMVDRLDPAFHLALIAAAQAWRDARTESVDPRRFGVVFGQIVLPTETASTITLDVLGRRFAERLGVSTSKPAAFEPRNAFPAGLPAAIVSEAFGLGGVAYTLDAACASSLYALKLAVDELKSGRADAMLAGGVSRPDALYTQMGFAQLRALSPTGRAHPLDHRADGLIVGEGAGIFVLKRLADARRHGDRIYGILAGIGLSNDIAGDLMAPDSEGQLRAMRSAYEGAGWSPTDVDMIECHATGTPRGDAVEVASLRKLWGASGWRTEGCAIGSVKANIGHALTAAGAAGLVKVLMSLKHRTLPPTANFERPNPALGLDAGPFRVLGKAEPWPERELGRPRRAALSGFGFGGINAHVLIEEHVPNRVVAVSVPIDRPEPIAVVGIAGQMGTKVGRDAFASLVLGSEIGPIERRIGSLQIPVSRFRIPPRELAEMLPQQSLMLRVAAEAIESAGWDARLAARTSVVVGIGLDLNTTNYYLRWTMADRARDWGEGRSIKDFTEWVDELREAAGPSLSANRTMGSLGGVVASRVARAMRIGGPSFSVSSDETSGIQALAIAVEWLRRGEIDAAIVGAIDLASDERAALARQALGADPADGTDAAFALVVKRLDDAIRDGDTIRAVIREVSTAKANRPGLPAEAGAAAGMAEVVRAMVGLADRVEPEDGRPARPWLRNRDEEPRHLRVETLGLGGTSARVALEEGPAPTPRLTTPPRRFGLFAIEADDPQAMLVRIDDLGSFSDEHSSDSIHELARRWWRRHPAEPRARLGTAIVAGDVEELKNRLIQVRRSSFERIGPRGVAFVYPGLGSYFEGMGRELGLLWPEVLDRQDAESRSLRTQLAPDLWWGGRLPDRFEDHRAPVLGQVAVGSLITDVLLGLGIRPDAAIGYSLGESAALVALRAWPDRDELARRLQSSPLFATELSGRSDAARRAWNVPPDRPVDWVAGIVTCSDREIRAAIDATGESRVYILIRNAPDETVIGGARTDVWAIVRRLKCGWIELPTVSTVHCPIGRLVESEYEAMHEMETSATPGIAFYSGISGSRYAVDRRSAARAIAAQAAGTIDFPRTIESAHADGVGLFIEIGPGGSCTRLIGRILGDRPHLAVSACRPDRDALAGILDVVAACIVFRVPVDLARLHGDERTTPVEPKSGPMIRVDVGPPEFRVQPLPPRTVPTKEDFEPAMKTAVRPDLAPIAAAMLDADRARAEAHRAFLRVSQGAADLMARYLALRLDQSGPVEPHERAPASRSEAEDHFPHEPALFDRKQCLELAVGSVASVFGPEFEEVDRLPTRVRLPDEPLMFVDRIVTIEGERRSMSSGRIITEHDIRPGSWYLDGNRVAPCVAMEAGQADLVLSGYLGVDFVTRGRSLYRLLDANVTFHRSLPVVGQTMRYDIRITQFFRQGTTVLFRFEYDATVGGEPLITMRDGCAGFFTEEELAAGKGVAPSRLDSRRREQVAVNRGVDLVPTAPTSLDEAGVEALRRSDLASAFGAPFDVLPIADPVGLPGGLMAMLRRVPKLEPAGGPAGLGFIRAEADVRPGDWYMVCHFIDDRVMPGTLMYECCLHAMRTLLMRQGWVGAREAVAFEPVPGVANRLKCRGQITESTRIVACEITIKERGYRPEPYAIADALILADGKPIVSVTDLGLQLSGTNRAALEEVWGERSRVRP